MVALVGLAISGAFMFELPGRTSSHARISMSEIAAPPTAEGFQLDGMTWSLPALKAAPSLAPFRTLFDENCRDRNGLDAALCVSHVLAQKFPHGIPSHEFLAGAYEPAADLHDHLAGEPGHCVTRSGLLSTALLAVGIPARQVQIDYTDGHNILEVFDSKLGWVVLDPSFGVVWGSKEHPLSIADSIGKGVIVPVRIDDLSPAPMFELTSFPLSFNEALYPDPWLYTRVGKPAATFPFRGRFAHVGRWSLKYGVGQQLARTGAILSTLILAWVVVRALRQKSRAANA